MIEAITDPTLAALVPRRSTTRNVLVASVGVAALVAAWFSAEILRVSVADDYAGVSGWETIEGRPEVLTMTTIDPHGWPWMTVESVADLPGARVVGAWVVPSMETGRPTATPGRFADTVDYLRHRFPDLDAGRLPTRLRPGSSGALVVLWEVRNCDYLDADVPAVVDLRSALGAGTREELTSSVMSPAWDPDLLAKAGGCP